MNVGFTGTRVGMSDRQKAAVRQALTNLFTPGSEFHHGRCVGSDIEAAEIAREIGYRTIGHPGPAGIYRDDSWVDDEIRLAKSYRARNQDIVKECEYLLAAPLKVEIADQRSGTWQTIRYAVKVGRRREVFPP